MKQDQTDIPGLDCFDVAGASAEWEEGLFLGRMARPPGEFYPTGWSISQTFLWWYPHSLYIMIYSLYIYTKLCLWQTHIDNHRYIHCVYIYICICCICIYVYTYIQYVYMCILCIILNRLMNSRSDPITPFSQFQSCAHSAQAKESIVAEMQKVWRGELNATRSWCWWRWDPTVLQDLPSGYD